MSETGWQDWWKTHGGVVSGEEVNIFMRMRRTMCVFDTRDVRSASREGGGQLTVTLVLVQAARWSSSTVTSADRNRRACGGGCALFVSRLSESSHSHSYDCEC